MVALRRKVESYTRQAKAAGRYPRVVSDADIARVRADPAARLYSTMMPGQVIWPPTLPNTCVAFSVGPASHAICATAGAGSQRMPQPPFPVILMPVRWGQSRR